VLPKIQEAADQLKAAETHMKATLAREQKKCSHARVIHSKWRSGEFFGPFKARRLCLDCGLEEEAKNSGWGDGDSDFKRLKTGGFHKVVDSYEIYKARFPEADVDVTA
jgi:hypothetical protein